MKNIYTITKIYSLLNQWELKSCSPAGPFVIQVSCKLTDSVLGFVSACDDSECASCKLTCCKC